MLAKSQRLNLKTSFKWVAAGEKIQTSSSIIFYRFGENKTPKIGVAVKSASFKSAIDRNRAKRLFFTAIQKLYQQLLPNLNMVIMPKPDVLTLDSLKIEVVLNEVFKSYGLLKKE